MRLILFILLFCHPLVGVEPCTLIIFGSSGNLATKKLYPALERIGEEVVVIGVNRRGISPHFGHSVKLDFEDHYEALGELIGQVSKGPLLYYLATEPHYYETILNRLYEANLLDQQCRVLCEKPFGEDLESAKNLEKTLKSYLKEEQIYRVDHYLAKRGVEELNGPWVGVKSVEIGLSEAIGIEGRASFWEKTGAIKDLLQSHLLQLMALVAKDGEKVDILQNTKIIDPVVRGQYIGYRDEIGVDPHSDVETFISVNVSIDNDRWRDIPFRLWAGKGLGAKYCAVTIRFQEGDDKVIPIWGDSHEKVLTDCMRGDRTLFVTEQEQLEAWRIVQPLLDSPNPLVYYGLGNPPPVSLDEVD